MDTKILTIDTTPEIDPYHRDTHQLTTTRITINPQDRKVWITQECDDNAMSMAEWHGVEIGGDIHGYYYLHDYAARAYLESPEGQSLLDTICEGHSVEWDGSNYVGALSDAARAAFDELITDLVDLCDWDLHIMTAAEYWYDYCRSELTADMTDDEIHALVEQSRDPDYLVLGNEEMYIRRNRDLLLAAIDIPAP
jgi:hypothetical protein